MRVISKVSQSIHKKYLLYTSCRFIILAFILSLDDKHFPIILLICLQSNLRCIMDSPTARQVVTLITHVHIYHISTYHMNDAKNFHVNALSNLFTD